MLPLARLPRRALLLAAVFLLLVGPSTATAAIVIVNVDGAGEGFNDAEARDPVGGNTATTLGEQRLAVFEYAASLWADVMASPVDILVQASFDPLTCNAVRRHARVRRRQELFHGISARAAPEYVVSRRAGQQAARGGQRYRPTRRHRPVQQHDRNDVHLAGRLLPRPGRKRGRRPRSRERRLAQARPRPRLRDDRGPGHRRKGARHRLRRRFHGLPGRPQHGEALPRHDQCRACHREHR